MKYTIPTTITPVIAPAIPLLTPPPLLAPAIYAAIIGEINANELPKKTGDFAFVQAM